MNGVIYARYSSDNQREESIEGQLRECREFAKRQGITVVGNYIDRALSAKTDDRPEFQRMVKDSARRLFDVVIVWKLDRFARNRYDSAYYKMQLKKNGARVVSAKENISDRPEGILLESMLEGYAEFYSAELSEKVLRGLKENALKALYNGGGMPLGYCADAEKHFQIVEHEAVIVREVFTRFAGGETIAHIISDLNDRGLRTKSGKLFRPNSLHMMLHNRKYIGEYRYLDVVIPNGVPRIVSDELFDSVQERLSKCKRAPAREKAVEKYLLTTKLFCGKCGAYMTGESGRSKTGAVHHYYKCAKAKRGSGCKLKAVKKNWIEDFVVNYTMRHILAYETIQEMADLVMELQTRENTVLPALKKQLKDTERGIDNMLNAIQQGIITSSTKQRLDELEAAKENLVISIAQEEMQKPLMTREQVVYWISRFKSGNPKDEGFRQRLIDAFINSIYLYDDRIILNSNYKDGARTITLEEVEEAFGDWGMTGSDLTLCAPPKKKTPQGVFFFG